MLSAPLNAFIVGFYYTHEVIERLTEEKIIQPSVWLEHELTYGTHSVDEVLESASGETQRQFDVPVEIYKELFNKHFSFFFSNLARRDSYTGQHTAYPEARYIFSSLLSCLYDLFLSKNIQLYIHSTYPHEVVDSMAYLVAGVLGVKRILMPPLFYTNPERFFIMDDLSDYGRWRGLPIVDETAVFDISQYGMTPSILKNHANAGRLEKYRYILKALFPYSILNRIKKAQYEYNLRVLTTANIDLNSPFVYFPLHYQPEASICAQSEIFWDDQSILVERISKIIPPGYKIFIKENPLQTFYYRDPKFFSNIFGLKNVVLVSSDISSKLLVEKCQFVATVTGTAGWEALAIGKPVVFSGYPLYREVRGAVEYRDSLTLEEIMQSSPNLEDVVSDGREVLMRAYRGNPNPISAQNSEANNKLVLENIRKYLQALRTSGHVFPKRNNLKVLFKQTGEAVDSTKTVMKVRYRYLMFLTVCSSIKNIVLRLLGPFYTRRQL